MDQNPRSFFKITPWLILLLGFLGFTDTLYLTYEHFAGTPVNCSILNGCDKVLSSQYSTVWGIPLAMAGTLYYLTILTLVVRYLNNRKEFWLKIVAGLTTIGFLFSIWLTYLQVFTLKALCLYCLTSAASSTLLFILTNAYLVKLKRSSQNGIYPNIG